MQPLAGTLVVDFTRYLPGAYASRELLRLGARVVQVEPPGGDPLRATPVWHARLRAGSESVVLDLPAEADVARALCARADVVLASFRPGVSERLGIGPDDMPSTAVYCSITGFGSSSRHERRAGHDLNYLGWAGALADTAPALPPIPLADLAAGALTAVTRVLAALLERTSTGEGARIVVSMTHGSHDLVDYRLAEDAVPRMLSGALACYRIYETADGRHLTVAALEEKFFGRLCAVLERPELAERQRDADQESLARELAAIFATRPLAHWLELCDDEDVCVGPVATLADAATEFAAPEAGSAPALDEHGAAWRGDLSVA